jgi:predicted membrane channel-forming protein YqfA (hemolysin III family)
VFVAVEGYFGGFPISDGPRKASSAMSCPFSRLKKANRSSMAGHALTRNKIKKLFRLFDHSAIFLLIAGTYTPFALGALHGVWGWTLFSLIWSLAILGIGFKVLGGLQQRAAAAKKVN